ncbi:MAG: P1 family peptidase, partial [Pseudolabrys sp.]
MARNLITDIAGIRVGHAGDAKLGSGVTAVVFDSAVTASVDVRGGGPGTRETALLDPAQTVEGIDAVILSGGSAFGLDAASGAQAYMREQGRGFRVRDAVVPIIPAAIMFDLLNGGDK